MAANWVDTLSAPQLLCTNANWNSSFLWSSQHKSQTPSFSFSAAICHANVSYC